MDNDNLPWAHTRRRAMTVLVIVVLAGASGTLAAQWFKYPSPRAPRTSSGEVDLSAATPRLANGKPDLSGVWMTGEPACVIRGTAPLSDLLKLIPRERTCPARTARPNFGHLEIEVTVDDPKAYTKPWTVTLRQQFAGDTELIDEICAEGEKLSKQLK